MTEYQKLQQKFQELKADALKRMSEEEFNRILKKKKDDAIAIVKLLVENGADLDAQDINGNTALHHSAIGFGYIESAKIIADAGADTTIKNKDGKTAIQLAYERGYDELGDLLKGYTKSEDNK